MVSQSSHIESAIQLDGVLAIAIVDSTGHVIESECKPPYDPVLFEESFSGVLAAVEQREATGSSGSSKRALQASLDDGYFFVRELDEEWLSVLTDRSVHVPRLNVALNVIEARRASARASSPQNAPILQSMPLASERRAAPGRAGVAPSASAHRSSEHLLTRLYGNRPEVVDRAAMEHLIKVASRYFGDQTTSVLRLEMAALQISPSACSSQDFRDLIRRLCIHLDEAKAERFGDEVLGD